MLQPALAVARSLALVTLAGTAIGVGQPALQADDTEAQPAIDPTRSLVEIRIEADPKPKNDLPPVELLRTGVVVADDVVAFTGLGALGKRTYRVGLDSKKIRKATREYIDPGTGLVFVQAKGLTAEGEPSATFAPIAASVGPADLSRCEVLRWAGESFERIAWDDVGPAVKDVADRRAQDRRRRSIGGAPIVDEVGGLVGIAQWSPPGEPLGWVPADKVWAALERAKWSSAKKGSARTTSAEPVFPRLSWVKRTPDSPKKRDAALVNGGDALADLDSRVWCTHCKGNGEVFMEDSREGPGGGRFSKAIIECKDCTGGRLEDSRMVKRTIRNLVTIAMESFAPDLDGTLRDNFVQKADAGINAAVALDRERMQSEIRAFGLSRLDVPQVGRCVAIWVERDEWADKSLESWAGDVRILDVHAHGRILLADFAPGKNPGKDQSTVVLGVIAGTVRVGKRDCIVLERSVAVAIDESIEPPSLR